jgi:exodeoxyribonuclease VIII
VIPDLEQLEAIPQLITSGVVHSALPRSGYEAISGWNASLLKVAITRTPAHAWAAFLDPQRPPSKDSPAFRIGTLLHQAILEPEEWQRIVPCSSGATTKAFAQAAKDAAAEGKAIAQASEHELAAAMAQALVTHPALGTLLAHTPEHLALNELTLCWTDTHTGQPCRGRLDAVRVTDYEIQILDLKTTADAGPAEFGRSAAKFGYLLQAAFYSDGLFYCARSLETLLGLPAGKLIGRPVVFEFVCVEKEAPHLVARYRVTTEQMVAGRRLYRKALEMVSTAETLGWWPGYDTAPVPLELPAWAWTQLEILATED